MMHVSYNTCCGVCKDSYNCTAIGSGFTAARLLGVGGSGKGSCARRLPAFSPPVCIQANPKLYGHGALPGRLQRLNPLIEAYDCSEWHWLCFVHVSMCSNVSHECDIEHFLYDPRRNILDLKYVYNNFAQTFNNTIIIKLKYNNNKD